MKNKEKNSEFDKMAQNGLLPQYHIMWSLAVPSWLQHFTIFFYLRQKSVKQAVALSRKRVDMVLYRKSH
jgi:hypothetical protein